MKLYQFLGLFCCLQWFPVHRYAVGSCSSGFLAGMVEVSYLTVTQWSVQMAEQEFWGKGKTLTGTVFYAYTALRENIID